MPSDPTRYRVCPSPIGPLTLYGTDNGLTRLYFPKRAPTDAILASDARPFARAAEQLDEYFAGERERFELTVFVGDELIGGQTETVDAVDSGRVSELVQNTDAQQAPGELRQPGNDLPSAPRASCTRSTSSTPSSCTSSPTRSP